MRNITQFKVERMQATEMYPNTDKKLMLSFIAGKQQYSFLLTNTQAKMLEAKLTNLFGVNEYKKEQWLDQYL